MGRRRRRASEPDLCGVLLVDKPAGPTSHDVVGWVRWALGVSRVGHCGTLDPAATGLLVVGVGPATKLAPYLTGLDKRYDATIVLGRSTTTADAMGETVEQHACPVGLEDEVATAVASLRGTHELPPPAFSAVHVDGKRAHELARAGEAVALPTRPMTVLEVGPPRVARHGETIAVEVSLLVSKGTYIRTLAEELGRRLSIPAHLGRLHRTAAGRSSLAGPGAVIGLSSVQRPPAPNGRPRVRVVGPMGPDAPREVVGAWLGEHLRPPAEAVPMPCLRVPSDDSGLRALLALGSGQPVPLERVGTLPLECDLAPATVAVAGPDGVAGLVIARVSPARAATTDTPAVGATLHPERVIVPPKHP